MIPKVIHYCWFGGNPKPEIIQKCIESWKKYCPDWHIIEWNESNYDISKSTFMEEAYENKKFGFVPDYARFDILHEMGGVYLDTDVELIGSIDHLLQYDAFYAFETERNINCGQCIGGERGHPSLSACLSFYLDKHFIVNGKMDMTPSPSINTTALCSCYGKLVRNGQTQIIDNVLFMSCGQFNSIAKHYGTATWVDGYKAKPHPYRGTWLKTFLRKPEKFDFIENHLGQRAVKIYTFFVYDVLENGLSYFAKRKLYYVKQKILRKQR